MTIDDFAQRCKTATDCLPEARYRGHLERLHKDMLDALNSVTSLQVEQKPVALFLLHAGQIDSSGEQDDWDVEADSWKAVEDFCRKYPGQTIKLYAGPEPVQQPSKCPTCNGNGLIGGPSFHAPDEGGVPCPDCSQASVKQEPVAWAVYVAAAQNFYVVDSEDDAQLVDDCTNHGAEVWPLYTHPAPVQEPLTENQEREAFEAWVKDEDRKNPSRVRIFQDKIGVDYPLARMMFTAFKAGRAHSIGGEK